MFAVVVLGYVYACVVKKLKKQKDLLFKDLTQKINMFKRKKKKIAVQISF